eukprot:CAMPEP_0118971274 /NCGR_PEP_ID=MMETSP1173-20130426/7948_1 /TAXON_ID=1034831 /ORGANISM="Rhizochromulina marina cf, Strain CCMP1243" /LENGTH=65 /DNA_ID=CAMNT_0006920715 /DNA_START=1 /DNA_END=195 /DNA_ORIENTATION=-
MMMMMMMMMMLMSMVDDGDDDGDDNGADGARGADDASFVPARCGYVSHTQGSGLSTPLLPLAPAL